MNGVEDPLDPFLAAWRDDSLRPPLPQSREKARAAMLAAVASRAKGAHRAGALSLGAVFRLRRGRPRLVGSLAALTAAVTVGLFGWNAPVGSPLHGVRVARQSVQLAVPGANLVALHLQFAEENLADARHGVNPVASLADARSELDAARQELPADHSSPLWTRWGDDETVLGTEVAALGHGPSESGLVTASPVPPGAGTHPSAGVTEAPSADSSARASAAPSGQPGGSPSPSAYGGDDASPSPGTSPHGG